MDEELNFCRMCMGEFEVLLNMNNLRCNGILFNEIIIYLFGQEHVLHDGFTKYVCQSCFNSVKYCHLFENMCRKSLSKIKKYLETKAAAFSNAFLATQEIEVQDDYDMMKTCRICSLHYIQLLSDATVMKIGQILAIRVLEQFLDEKKLMDDESPKLICQLCCSNLQVFNKFKLLCENSFKSFSEYVELMKNNFGPNCLKQETNREHSYAVLNLREIVAGPKIKIEPDLKPDDKPQEIVEENTKLVVDLQIEEDMELKTEPISEIKIEPNSEQHCYDEGSMDVPQTILNFEIPHEDIFMARFNKQAMIEPKSVVFVPCYKEDDNYVPCYKSNFNYSELNLVDDPLRIVEGKKRKAKKKNEVTTKAFKKINDEIDCNCSESNLVDNSLEIVEQQIEVIDKTTKKSDFIHSKTGTPDDNNFSCEPSLVDDPLKIVEQPNSQSCGTTPKKKKLILAKIGEPKKVDFTLKKVRGPYGKKTKLGHAITEPNSKNIDSETENQNKTEVTESVIPTYSANSVNKRGRPRKIRDRIKHVTDEDASAVKEPCDNNEACKISDGIQQVMDEDTSEKEPCDKDKKDTSVNTFLTGSPEMERIRKIIESRILRKRRLNCPTRAIPSITNVNVSNDKEPTARDIKAVDTELPRCPFRYKGKKPFECKICGRPFARKTSLKLHEPIHTGERPHSCDVCGASFFYKCVLKEHMKSHMDSKNLEHKCSTCGKKFFLSFRLRMHERLHTGPYIYVCDICGKRHATARRLAGHKRAAHSVDSKYRCKWCGLRFVFQSKKVQHIKKEHSDKLYKCDKCSKRYLTKEGITKHVAVHEEKTEYECEHCNETFKDQMDLKIHWPIHFEHNCALCPTE